MKENTTNKFYFILDRTNLNLERDVGILDSSEHA